MTAPANARRPDQDIQDGGDAATPPNASQMARNLLDRPLPAGYREEWARHFARDDRAAGTEGSASEEANAVMIFRIGEEWLALPADACHDVVEPRPVHSLPHRRDTVVLGLVNVRGELLVCASLGELLHVAGSTSQLRAARSDGLRRMVVIGDEHRRIVFHADEVHGLRRCNESMRLAVPATISKAPSTFTTSMLAWEGRTVGCLDAALVLDMLDRSLA
ncbi:chew domain protein [Labrys miyagiensis]